jgi:Ca2+-binding RTX toxin-like protein
MSQQLTSNPGIFTVGQAGKVSLDFLYDGGDYRGELAIFSLKGMENLEVGSTAFIQEAARRALSYSKLGYVAISDETEGAKFSAKLSWENDYNAGTYKGIKNFTMDAGDRFAVMLVPHGKVRELYNNPSRTDSRRPLFSIDTANPNNTTQFYQLNDAKGMGNTFVFEDRTIPNGSDRDFNDVTFQIIGAAGEATSVSTLMPAGSDWRKTDVGKQVLDYASRPTYETGVFRVDASGQVNIDYLFDGGAYQGELAIFSLKGMENLKLDSPAFAQEAARRALSNSTLGRIVIQDSTDKAQFSAKYIWENDFNSGTYRGVRTFAMNPGEDVAVMMVQNSTVQNLYNNVNNMWSNGRLPIFSIPAANGSPNNRQMVDVTGKGDTFAMEDERLSWGKLADKDYNDIIFKVTGAKGIAPLMSQEINPGRDWSQSPVGKEMLQHITRPNFSGGVFDTGENGKVRIDFLYDGGWFNKGELAIFSLDGMEQFKVGSQAFMQEAARRALSNSTQGYVVVKDSLEGAKFSDKVAWENVFNNGAYQGIKTFQMESRGHFAFMLVQNNSVASIANNPSAMWQNGNMPIFSIPEANAASKPIEMVKIGDRGLYGFEDVRMDRSVSDKDYNDLIIQVKGATSNTALIDTHINPNRDWRNTQLGNNITTYANRPEFEKGVLTTDGTGRVEVEFLYDGGYYKGEVGIFSLAGMDSYQPGSEAFIREATRRVRSNSAQGYVVVQDSLEGAKFTGGLDWEGNFNQGSFNGVKVLTLNPNDSFGIMQVPNGTIAEVANNPKLDGAKRPLFSMLDSNPAYSFQIGKIDMAGGSTIVSLEDQRLDGISDRDYNDIILRFKGLEVAADPLDRVMASGKDWRATVMGEKLFDYVNARDKNSTTPEAFGEQSGLYLHGTRNNDTLLSNTSNDYLAGREGNDNLLGREGNDILVGGVGNDTLFGGVGNDTFKFNSLQDAGDTIGDFSTSDRLNLDSLFTSLNYLGSTPVADGYLQFQQVGVDTQVLISANGTASNWVRLATVSNINASTLASNTVI